MTLLLALLSWLLAALVAGSAVYCVLVTVAATSYRSVVPPPATPDLPPLSVLKPLAGADEGLEENLRSFFEQNYPAPFEILFAVRHPNDAAIPIAERLREQYVAVPSRLIIVGDPPYPNAKVFSLQRMVEVARHEVLVMSDSDIRVEPDFLEVTGREFLDPKLGLSTCPYRAVAGESIWSTLEAINMNTEFLGGVLVARMIEGMKFALGPTLTIRREVLARIGGFAVLKDYLAEDFVMGNRAAESGAGVILSSYVIEHRIGSQDWPHNREHRLRWNRSTRRSRPAGYLGQIFTNPLPFALLLPVIAPQLFWLSLLAVAARIAAAWATAGVVLRDPLTARLWWAVPLQDLLSFGFWVAGFFGDTILWRGRKYKVLRDGRFRAV